MTESFPLDWSSCLQCGSRATRRHCQVVPCGWVTCKQCGATSGVTAQYDGDGTRSGWRRAGFPRQPRILE